MRALRRVIAFLLVVVLLLTGFYFFYMKPRKVIPILMYHSISDDRGSSLNVTAENFDRQMRFLVMGEYSVISLDDLVRGIRQERKFHPKTVVITFDDGFEDNYLKAFPVLAKYKLPATIFLVAGYISEREGYLDWDQVKLMMDNGIDFGAHTVNNVYLPSVEDTRTLWWEVHGPRNIIENNTGKAPGYFCYPTGGFNTKVKNAVKRAGYEGACTTNRGFDRLNRDVYELNRIKVTNSDMTKPFHFRAKLSGYYNLFRSPKKGD
ncbi:MAG: polysaccharide deacetylase family protein [Candidatus Omnitrophica bacterium]|nr:polysaccharide deacetylase family protein [Candidatus Omnitrophota bacterium]